MPVRIAVEVESRGLRLELQKITQRRIPRLRGRIVELVSTEVRTSVVERTPVESGEAREGWNDAGNSETGNGSATEARITNRVRHILFLEDGTKRMRPRHMAKRTMEGIRTRLGAIVRQAVSEELG